MRPLREVRVYTYQPNLIIKPGVLIVKNEAGINEITACKISAVVVYCYSLSE